MVVVAFNIQNFSNEHRRPAEIMVARSCHVLERMPLKASIL